MDTVYLNDNVGEYPFPSERYRKVFNDKANELGYGFAWTSDDQNYNCIDAGELTVTAEAARQYGVDGTIPSHFSEPLAKDVKSVLQEVEKQRLQLAEAAALYHKRYSYRAPLELLTPVERRAVDLFAQEVKPLVSRIDALQNNPQASAQALWMERHGDYYSRMQFNRFHHDQGGGPYHLDPRASLLPTFPDKPAINGMIAPDITLDQFREMTRNLPANAEELRPTTLLSRTSQGDIVATPLPQHPAFQDLHARLADACENIAGLEVDNTRLDPLLSGQLRAWAAFFRSGTREDEKTAAQATIDAGESAGNLRLHIGPSESYWPDNTKFPYLLMLGIRDPQMSEELRQWKDSFPTVEQSLSDIPNYTPRQLSVRGGFADPMYQAMTSGFMESFYGREPRGANYPNYSYGAEGSNRFILMETLPPLVADCEKMAAQIMADQLTAHQVKYLNDNVVLFATGHESGHLIGPQRDHVTPSGERMGAVFGQRWGSAEEAKADLTALELAYQRERDGQITPDKKTSLMQASLLFAMAIYPGKQQYATGTVMDHAFGYIMEVGYYFRQGALSLANGKIAVDYDRFQKASHDLWKQIITYQAAGDVNGFMSFADGCVNDIPDEADALICGTQKDMRQYFVERHL